MDLLESFFNEYLEEDPETKIYRVNLKYKINQFLFEKSMEYDTDLFHNYDYIYNFINDDHPAILENGRRVMPGLKWRPNIYVRRRYENP